MVSFPGGGAKRRHHISSIAHHFLDDEASVRKAPGGGGPVVVCGPGSGQLVARTCAALVRALVRKNARSPSHQGVMLTESRELPWSSTSYLLDLGLEDLSRPDQELTPHRFDCWLASKSAQGTGSVGVPGEDELPDCRLHHLGGLAGWQLKDLEQVGSPTFPGESTTLICRSLVWCTGSRELASLTSRYLLGRLLRLTRAGGLEIVAVNDSDQESGPDPLTDELGQRLLNGRSQVVSLFPATAAHFTWLGPGDVTGLDGGWGSLGELVARISLANDSD